MGRLPRRPLSGDLVAEPGDRALVIVNNSSQLLFALEAAHHFKLRMEQLSVVCIPTPGDRDTALYDTLLADAGVLGAHRLPLSVLTRRGRIRCSMELAMRARHSEWVITPMLHFLPARVALNFSAGASIVTDEGAWTLKLSEVRRSGRRNLRRVHSLVPMGQLPTQLTIFSIYHGVLAGPKDTVVANELSWTRARARVGQRMGEYSVVLGSDLVGASVLSRESYLAELQRLRSSLPGRVEYWPHRREDLVAVTDICSRLGMERRERQAPLELEILLADPAPSAIGTLPSTSIRTLRMLQEAMAFKIFVAIPRDELIPRSRREDFRDVSEAAIADADMVV